MQKNDETEGAGIITNSYDSVFLEYALDKLKNYNYAEKFLMVNGEHDSSEEVKGLVKLVKDDFVVIRNRKFVPFWRFVSDMAQYKKWSGLTLLGDAPYMDDVFRRGVDSELYLFTGFNVHEFKNEGLKGNWYWLSKNGGSK